MKRPLESIYLMVKQAMLNVEQVTKYFCYRVNITLQLQIYLKNVEKVMQTKKVEQVMLIVS